MVIIKINKLNYADDAVLMTGIPGGVPSISSFLVLTHQKLKPFKYTHQIIF